MKNVCLPMMLLLCTVNLFAVDSEISSFDWPNFRGTNYTGIYTEKDFDAGKLSSKSVLWKKNIGTGYSAPAIVGKKLFILGYDTSKDIIRCLNRENGSEIWSFSYKSYTDSSYPGPRSSPTYYEGKIYILGRGADLYCLNANTGKEIWHKNVNSLGAQNPGWDYASSVYVTGNIAVVNASQYGMAFNKDTGNLVWKSPDGIGSYATPVAFTYNGTEFLAIFSQNKLNAVNRDTGKQLWSINWKTGYDVNAADPLVFDNKIFISSAYSVGCALFDFSAGSPKQIWKNKNVASHFHSAIYHKGMIFACSGDAGNSRGAAFRCINPADGSIVWEQRLGFAGFILADDKFILCNESGKVYIFKASASSYSEIASAQFDPGQYWTAPVLSRGLLYIRSSQGLLTCIDLSK